MTPLSPELTDLGDALHAAVSEELAAAGVTATPAAVTATPAAVTATPAAVTATPAAATATPAAGAPRRRLRRLRSHPRILAAVAIVAVGAPSVAAAAGAFDSPQQVAASIPAGTLALLHTEPTCTVVTQGVEYHCTLSSAPTDQGGPEPGQWLSTVEPTVDQNQKVNGGCRSLNGAGTEWECYLGETAVHQKIIGQGFLGQKVSGPGVG